ncbi:hypothetical protein [Moorella sulfitireducens (nom. illeg.)]|uniref:hypothetical protein n=1 Tax=Neomoorella sulfitireducens TaxID=2972948 RepID=UPI0021ABF01A|nr:hypothetical protein [Moorella sulfitireducens]
MYRHRRRGLVHGKVHPHGGKLIGGPVFAIVIGMILVFIKRPAVFTALKHEIFKLNLNP